MLEIVHLYRWNKEESKWFTQILELFYGPYLLLKSVKLGSDKFKNITIEQLSFFELSEDEELTVKIKYEPMQATLLPEIPNFKRPLIKFDLLLKLCATLENVQFSCTNLNDFAMVFIVEFEVKRGFYDQDENAYFLLLKNGKVYELSSCGLYLLGNISLDLNAGFFGACENLLHEHWNETYFIPWKRSKIVMSPFPTIKFV